MKQEKDSSKEFIVLNALAFYTSRNFLVELVYHPYSCEYYFKVFVDKGVEFPSYRYLADIATSHDCNVFEEETNVEFTTHTFVVNCTNKND